MTSWGVSFKMPSYSQEQEHLEQQEKPTIKQSDNHHTFLSRRFDRTNVNERLHFASAMTLLQRSDGDVAVYFRIAPTRANSIIQDTTKTVRRWRQEAKRLGLASNEQDHMARAFRIADHFSGKL
jgi:hypothetical protein